MSRSEMTHQVMLERLSAVLSSTRAISSKLHLEEAIRAILAEGRRILEARTSLVWMLDESGSDCELYVSEGYSSDEVERLIQERRATVGFRAAIESREIIIPDLGRQAGAPESVFARPSVAYAAVFAVPLRLREAALGSMVFTYPEPKVPSESELDLARTFASHAAIAIHKAKLFERTEEQVSQLRALATAAHSLAEAEDLEEILEVILAEVRRVLAADRCRIVRWTDKPGKGRVELASYGLSKAYLTALDRRVGTGVHTIRAMPGRPVVVEDALEDPRLAGIRDLVLLEGYVTLLHLSLSSRGAPIGTLAIYYDQKRHFSAENLALAQTFADLAASAIKEAEHRAGFCQERDRLRSLALAAGSLAEAKELDEVLDVILTEVRRVLGADRCRILRSTGESEGGRVELASYGLSEAYLTELKRRTAEGLYEPITAKPGKPVQVVDARTDPGLGTIRDLILKEGFVTIASIGMSANGTPVGYLVLYHDQARQYTPEDMALAQAFADLAAAAIKEADERAGLRQERNRLNALAAAAERITSELDLKVALKVVMEEGSRVLGAERCGFWLQDEQTGRLELLLNRGLSERYLSQLLSQRDAWVTGKILASNIPAAFEDARSAPELRHMWEAYEREGIHSAVFLPLRYLGRPLGVLVFYHNARRRYAPADLDLAMTFAHQAAIAIQNAREHEAALRAERLSAMGELVAGVAHEINNPLTTILMCAQLIQTSPSSTDHVKQVETIIDQTKRCARVVEKLLAFARETEKREEELDLADVMRDALGPAMPSLSLHNIEVSCTARRGSSFVLGDRHLLQQVFLNLITNAQHALLDREPPRLLEIDIRPQRDECVVRIADNGCGIPPEVLGKVFEPFFTTKGEGKGTGLGLSIAYGIVKDHGGDIAIESQPGAGTTIRVSLPRLKAPGKSKTTVIPSVSWSALSGRRVLVIEDEMNICKYLMKALSPVGVKVTTAHSLAEARKALQGAAPDLILADIRLPDGNGFHLYEEVTASGLVRPDRFAFMSGDIASEETFERLKGSGRPQIPKPFGINDIRQFLCECMGGDGSAELEGAGPARGR